MKKIWIFLCVVVWNISAFEDSRNELELIMAGDALLHASVYQDAKQNDHSYDFSSMLENLAPVVSKYDLAFYNQETILGGVILGLSTYPAFNSPQEFGDNMLALGFNLVSLAKITHSIGERKLSAHH